MNGVQKLRITSHYPKPSNSNKSLNCQQIFVKMNLVKIIAGVAPMGAAFLYSPVKVYAKESVPCHECRMKRLPKAQELPLYEIDEEKLKVEFVEEPPTALETQIAGVRQHLSKYVTFYEEASKRATDMYETGVAHTQSTYDTLMNSESRVPKVIAITSGGIVGLLISLRGGLIKKIVYPATGVAVVSSALYPKEAKEYLASGFEITQNYVNDILVNYGGYDTKEIAEKTSNKLEHLKKLVRMDWLTDQLREQFNKNKSTKEPADKSDKNDEKSTS